MCVVRSGLRLLCVPSLSLSHSLSLLPSLKQTEEKQKEAGERFAPFNQVKVIYIKFICLSLQNMPEYIFCFFFLLFLSQVSDTSLLPLNTASMVVF